MKDVINERTVREMRFVFKYNKPDYKNNLMSNKIKLSKIDYLFSEKLNQLKSFLVNNNIDLNEWNISLLIDKANRVKQKIEEDFFNTNYEVWNDNLNKNIDIAINEYNYDFNDIDDEYEECIEKYEEYYGLLFDMYDETYNFFENMYMKLNAETIVKLKDNTESITLYSIEEVLNEFKYQIENKIDNKIEYGEDFGYCLAA